jgi:hypothetical protein
LRAKHTKVAKGLIVADKPPSRWVGPCRVAWEILWNVWHTYLHWMRSDGMFAACDVLHEQCKYGDGRWCWKALYGYRTLCGEPRCFSRMLVMLQLYNAWILT